MKIEIKSVDPALIRYATCGNWLWLPDGTLQIFVPEYGGRDYNAYLVALHKMIEAWAYKRSGIKDQITALDIEKKACAELKIDWDDHQKWVENSTWEVNRSHEFEVPKISQEGSRYWAELHLYALRHKGSDSSEWLKNWMADLPFEKCPCEEHLKEFLVKTPPDFSKFFEWTIALHNDVNDRIGRSIISVDDARVIWSSKSF